MIQYKDFVPIYPYLISEGDEIVRGCDRYWDETVTLTKHVTKHEKMDGPISQQMSKSASLKSLQLTQFAWPNLSIYFNFLCAVPHDDVIESTRFLMRPPVIIPPRLKPTNTASKKFTAWKRGASFDAFEVACLLTFSLDTIRSAVEAFHTNTSVPMLHI